MAKSRAEHLTPPKKKLQTCRLAAHIFGNQGHSTMCSYGIGPADAMVIAVAVVSKLLASNYRTFLLANLSIFITRKGPSTHVINATSFVTM
jgi:hypothetical protein